jgi:hypothetical protein
MRPLVVVVLDPLPYPINSILKAPELSTAEELQIDLLPEPFDLAQDIG